MIYKLVLLSITTTKMWPQYPSTEPLILFVGIQFRADRKLKHFSIVIYLQIHIRYMEESSTQFQSHAVCLSPTQLNFIRYADPTMPIIIKIKILEELSQPSVRFGKASSLEGGGWVFFHLPKCLVRLPFIKIEVVKKVRSSFI